MQRISLKKCVPLWIPSGRPANLSAPLHHYGYQKDPENKNRLFVDGPAAEVVRRIFEEYLAGQSMAGIARRLNQEGVLPPSRYKAEIQRLPYHNANAVQGVWRAETIRTILGNPLMRRLAREKREMEL